MFTLTGARRASLPTLNECAQTFTKPRFCARGISTASSASAARTKSPRDAVPSLCPDRKPLKRNVPEEAQRFINKRGELRTTSENQAFLLRHGLEHDTGIMHHLQHRSPEMRSLNADFKTMVAFAPRHVVHPYDLKYFDPRGHPLAPSKCAKYLRKMQTEQLWIHMVNFGPGSAVVRRTAARRLKSAVFEALRSKGYATLDSHLEGKTMFGTVLITLNRPLDAANQDARRFGQVVADALEEEIHTYGDR